MRLKLRWKSTLLIGFIYLSSILAIIMNIAGHFDPVAMAEQYFSRGDRDTALEVIGFGLENRLGDPERLTNLKSRYEYTSAEKLRDLFYTGALKGQVTNVYSGLGAIGADLTLLGDLRDLTIQGVRKLQGQEVDNVVTALSAFGVAATAVQATGGGAFADAGLALAKAAAKYAKRFGRSGQNLLRAVVSGRRFTGSEYKKMWILFKQSGFSVPAFSRVLSRLKHADELDPALDVLSGLKKGGPIFIRRAGRDGLSTYARLTDLGFGRGLLTAFKSNPSGVLGMTRFHALIAGTKFIRKEGLTTTATLAVSSLAMLLAILPGWVAYLVFFLTTLWLIKRTVDLARRRRRASPDEAEGPRVEFGGYQ